MLLYQLIVYKPFRVFNTVRLTGSFTEAAERERMTQPAVTFQIKSLEQQLGVKLLHRQPVSLTPAGQALAEILDQVQESLEKLDLNTVLLEAKELKTAVALSELSNVAQQAAIGDYRKSLTDSKVLHALSECKFKPSGEVLSEEELAALTDN